MRIETITMRYALLFFVVLALAGCGKAPPPDLPPLAPCKVKVHDAGKPLVNIGVSFRRIEGQAGWSLNAQTGSDGNAVAQTIAGSFSAKGIPTGTYRVALRERIDLPPELDNIDDPALSEKQRADLAAKQIKFIAEHRTLPEILCDPSKTPLELNVTDSGAELDIDIAQFK